MAESMILKIYMDALQAAKLRALASRMQVDPGRLASSVLSRALDEAAQDAATVGEILDAIPGAFEQAQQGLREARAGRGVTLDELLPAKIEPLATDVQVTEDEVIAHLSDGRTISVPLAWSWRLSEATPEQRNNFRLIGAGQGIHWPDVDEDISIHGMLEGTPAVRT